MSLPDRKPPAASLVAPATHALHEARSAEQFSALFEAATGIAVQNVADQLIVPGAPRAIFLVGSLPIGMASGASDIDFIALVDGRESLRSHEHGSTANTDEQLAFSNANNQLIAGIFVTLTHGIAVEVQVAISSTIKDIYRRLRLRGPELSESAIQTLGRLSRGWLLAQTDHYLERSGLKLNDPALDVYCSTRLFVDALILRRKAIKAAEMDDALLAFHLGRASVEKAFLSYFASEGHSYLGPKWIAQISQARDAAERVERHPLLKQSIPLLFPTLGSSRAESNDYLAAISRFLTDMRSLIEQQTLFRIAFHACPQIFPIT